MGTIIALSVGVIMLFVLALLIDYAGTHVDE